MNNDPWASYDRMFSPEYEDWREEQDRLADKMEEAAIAKWEAAREERYC